LKEDFNKSESEDAKDKTTKTGTTNPNPSFTWDLAFAEILQRDEQSKSDSKDKVEFPQFWIDTVDSKSNHLKEWLACMTDCDRQSFLFLSVPRT
jgi:hypothetical protein